MQWSPNFLSQAVPHAHQQWQHQQAVQALLVDAAVLADVSQLVSPTLQQQQLPATHAAVTTTHATAQSSVNNTTLCDPTTRPSHAPVETWILNV